MTHGIGLASESPGGTPGAAPLALPTGEPLATRSRRFCNLALDYVAVAMCVPQVQLLLSPVGMDWRSVQDARLLLFITGFLYYLGFEVAFGATPGKMLTGTRVVTESGGRPSLGQILGRTCARFIPFEPLSFFGKEAFGWHDSLSHTRVVRSRR
jgi:uncharacterized RDD family membrane protein YckC